MSSSLVKLIDKIFMLIVTVKYTIKELIYKYFKNKSNAIGALLEILI